MQVASWAREGHWQLQEGGPGDQPRSWAVEEGRVGLAELLLTLLLLLPSLLLPLLQLLLLVLPLSPLLLLPLDSKGHSERTGSLVLLLLLLVQLLLPALPLLLLQLVRARVAVTISQLKVGTVETLHPGVA